MRKIGPDGQLERMICNACGKKLAVRQGIVLEGAISIDHTWDYSRKKTGRWIILTCVKSAMIS